MRSLNDARFTMWATVIPRVPTQSLNSGLQPTGAGHFVRSQDPDSLEVITVWVPDFSGGADTTAVEASYDIQCYARGYTDLGYRSSGNREVYVKGEYNVIEAIQFDYPKNVTLNHQSFVTNIRGNKEDTDYFWTNEDSGQATVWECQGTTPVHDPFGKLLRFTAVLRRSEIQ